MFPNKHHHVKSLNLMSSHHKTFKVCFSLIIHSLQKSDPNFFQPDYPSIFSHTTKETFLRDFDM